MENSKKSKNLNALPYGPRRGDTLGLFCFAHAGGGASTFRYWNSVFKGRIQVLPVQLPGRETRFREKLFENIDEAVDGILDSIDTSLQAPFAFYGHSMGALIAYEITQRLLQTHRTIPTHLFLASCRSPTNQHTSDRWDLLPDELLWKKICDLGGTQEELREHEALRQIVIPTLRADLRMCATYKHRWRRKLECKATIIRGILDADVNSGDAWDWQKVFSSNIAFTEMDGGHFIDHAPESLVDQILGQLEINA